MQTNRWARAAAAACVLFLLAGACGGGDKADATATAPTVSEAADQTNDDPESQEQGASGDPVEDEEIEADQPEAARGGTIGFAYGLDDAPIYQNILAPVLAEAERMGYTIVEGAAASSCEAQQTDIENMVASGVDAVVILNLCPGGYDAQIQAAQNAGIAVVSYLWDHPAADGRILLADELPGEILADAVIEWYDNDYGGDPEDFAWILHGCSFAPPNIQLRTEIPKERVTAHTGIDPIEIDCALAPQPALDATLEALQAEPGINVVLGLIDGASLGSYAAFEQAEGFDRSNVFIAGVDGEPQAIELIADGGGTDGMYALSAAVDAEAVGFAVVRVSDAAIRGDTENALFQSRHVAITTADAAQSWFDRVYAAYSQ